MRSAVLFCACAIVPASGCAAGPDRTRLTVEQQWRTLCRRMPQRRLRAVADATPPPRLSTKQSAALRLLAAEAQDSVVQIVTAPSRCGDGGGYSSDAHETSTHSGGTGVVISSGGLILTNEHVVRGAEAVTVVLRDGAGYPVEKIVAHPRLDLAVIRIDRQALSPLAPWSDPAHAGAYVVAVSGSAHRPHHHVQSGIITDARQSLQCELDPARRRDYGDLVETTVALEPGFSGGPLLDSAGRFIGLNVAVAGTAGTDQCRGYAIPFNRRTLEAVRRLSAEATQSIFPLP